MASKKITFDNPPINEVVFGVKLDSVDFNLTNILSYWSTTKSNYPNEAQHPILLDKNEPLISNSAILPRIWFESENKNYLLQIQFDRFHYNWKKSNESDDYPRFESLYPKFESEFQNYSKHFSGKKRFYELTYMNHIDSKFGWSEPEDTNGILAIFNFEKIQKRCTLINDNLELQFLFDDDDLATIKIKNGRRISDNNLIMLLEITIRSKNVDRDMKKWFAKSNEKIVGIFTDLLTSESIKIFKRN